MLCLLVLAVTKVAADAAMAKLVAMGISSAISVYAVTKPRANERRPSRKR